MRKVIAGSIDKDRKKERKKGKGNNKENVQVTSNFRLLPEVLLVCLSATSQMGR
jgi:hypothetical protein